MRPISQDMYAVPRERVIGSSATFEYTSDGAAARLPTSPKPTTSTTARKSRSESGTGSVGGPCSRQETPTATLRCSSSPSTGQEGPRLLISRRPDREFDYTKGAERALDKPSDAWTVVSMKNDWATVF